MNIGPYQLLHQLNRGGMAIVWLARRVWDDGTVKIVVIKIPRKTVMVDPRQIKMFLDECKLTMQLDHGNIVTVFDAGIHEGLPWIAMQFVSGRNLAQLIAAVAEQGHEIEYEVAAHIALQLAYALQYAHEFKIGGVLQNIVHRDVAAKNVMISGAGDVLLTDFGVAAAATVEASGIHVKGTFRYMAPEHIRGHATQLSDAFGLGTVLWSLLEGREFRWDVDENGIVSAAMDGYIPPLTREGVPPRLLKVVNGLLALKEADRMSIAEAIEILETFTPQRTALKRMLSRYFGADVMRTGRTSVGFQSSEELEEALRIVGITGGAALLEQMEAKARPGPTEAEVRSGSPTIDISTPAAIRARLLGEPEPEPEPKPDADRVARGAQAPPIPPTERIIVAGELPTPPPSPQRGEAPRPQSPPVVHASPAPAQPLPQHAAAPVVYESPAWEQRAPAVRPVVNERPVPAARTRRAPPSRPLAASIMIGLAAFFGLASAVGIVALYLKEDPQAVAAKAVEPTSPARAQETVPAASAEPEPEPLELRGQDPKEQTAARTSETSPPEKEPEPSVAPVAEEPAPKAEAKPVSQPAASKATAKPSSTTAKPKVELKMAIGFIDSVEVRIGGRTHTLTREKGKDQLTIKIPAGEQTIRWRLAPSQPWEARTFDFIAGESHFVQMENDGPRSRARKVKEG